jgi:hypothetical protein
MEPAAPIATAPELPPITFNPRAAERIDVTAFFPTEAGFGRFRISVKPATGVVLIWTPAQKKAIRFDGPVTEGDVGLSGSFIFAQMTQGATDYKIETLGWR